jgi:hypothetical protein
MKRSYPMALALALIALVAGCLAFLGHADPTQLASSMADHPIASGLGFVFAGYTLDVFNSNAFSMRQLTAAILNLPYVPNRLGELDMFNQKGIATLVCMVEKKDGKVYLVPNTPRGASATRNQKELRQMIPLTPLHLPVEDKIMADEIAGIRMFGSEDNMEAIWEKVEERLATGQRSIEASIELTRVGAIGGRIVFMEQQEDGEIEMQSIDLCQLFGLKRMPNFAFNFATVTADASTEGSVRKQCSRIIRGIEDNLGNVPYAGVMGLCGEGFFDQLVDNPETRDAYKFFNGGQQLFTRTARRQFFYGGILWEEYRGKVGDTRFVPELGAQIFPVGEGLYDTVFAPANYIETVNTIGLPYYAKVTPDPKGRWAEVDIQSNPVSYATRPNACATATK